MRLKEVHNQQNAGGLGEHEYPHNSLVHHILGNSGKAEHLSPFKLNNYYKTD